MFDEYFKKKKKKIFFKNLTASVLGKKDEAICTKKFQRKA